MSSPRRALIVIDVQQEYFVEPLRIRHPLPEDSLARIIQAIDVAESHRIPVVVVRHENPVGSTLLASGTRGVDLHPDLADRVDPSWHRITKRYASAFDGTDLASWCSRQQVEILTLVGYMSNNCVLATAASAAPHGLSTEVLSDATGAIHLGNEIGQVPAHQLHHDLMVLLHSNLASVCDVEDWTRAVSAAAECPRSSLLASANQAAPAQKSVSRP